MKARKIALHLGIAVTGTIGIIVKAKLKNVIPSVSPILSKMKQAGFHLSAELETAAKRAAQEE